MSAAKAYHKRAQPTDFMSSNEAAEFLRVSEHRLRNLVSQGIIPYYKLGASNRYRRSELERILTNNRKGPLT